MYRREMFDILEVYQLNFVALFAANERCVLST